MRTDVNGRNESHSDDYGCKQADECEWAIGCESDTDWERVLVVIGCD